MNVQMHVEA